MEESDGAACESREGTEIQWRGNVVIMRDMECVSLNLSGSKEFFVRMIVQMKNGYIFLNGMKIGYLLNSSFY